MNPSSNLNNNNNNNNPFVISSNLAVQRMIEIEKGKLFANQ